MWYFINVILPWLPFGIKYFVKLIGKPDLVVFELNELYFLSIYYSIITLSLNKELKVLDGFSNAYWTKISFWRKFFLIIQMIIIILNTACLIAIYLNSANQYFLWKFVYIIIAFQILLLLMYYWNKNK